MKKYLTTSNCINCTKSSKCFQKLIHSELEFINENKTQIIYKKGETICKQNAFASYVMYIADGLVKLYIESVGNKHINIKILQTSEFLGLPSVYGENIYNCSASALKDSTICLIKKDSFRKLLNHNGNFASEIIKGYCQNENRIFDIVKSIGYKQMHGRIADTLLYLTSERFKDINIFSYITRKDIAEFSCISMESTVRLLSELKNDKIIDIKGKNITILNRELLNKISLHG
jgi:CRP-like cAMP-binding protein